AIVVVDAYRKSYPEIPHLWRAAEVWLQFMATARTGITLEIGPFTFERERFTLPNGNRLNYRNLRQEWSTEEVPRAEWWYDHGKRKLKLYGSKLVENMIQALAFEHIMEADARVAKRFEGKLELAHQVHDELIYIVSEKYALTMLDIVKE